MTLEPRVTPKPSMAVRPRHQAARPRAETDSWKHGWFRNHREDDLRRTQNSGFAQRGCPHTGAAWGPPARQAAAGDKGDRGYSAAWGGRGSREEAARAVTPAVNEPAALGVRPAGRCLSVHGLRKKRVCSPLPGCRTRAVGLSLSPLPGPEGGDVN